MYTRCPSCRSTFRVTAAVLQMAAGEVRCGVCGSTFNALHTLVDDWSGADLVLPGPAPAAEPQPGPPPQPAPDPALAEAEPPEAGLEFNVPEHEWQRFFLSPQEPAPMAAPRPEPALGVDLDGLLAEETADTDTWQGFLREAGLEARPDASAGDEATADADADPDAGAAGDEPLFLLGEESAHAEATLIMARPPAPATSGAADAWAAADDAGPGDDGEDAFIPQEEDGGLPVGDPERRADLHADHEDSAGASAASPGDEEAALAGIPAAVAGRAAADTVLDWGPPPFGGEPAAAAGHPGRWFAASLAAALLLGGQLLHHFRDELAASPAYGSAVRALYARLGLPLDPDWPLDAYEIRSVKALVENAPQGALDIVAEVAVTGRQPVGPPLLRVVLRDRWSNTVASGVFGPADYLADAPPPSSVYAPGTLIPVQISLKDPGTAAQGYELDVCMPNRHLGLQCKAGRDPFRR